jgi:hypothetical protein
MRFADTPQKPFDRRRRASAIEMIRAWPVRLWGLGIALIMSATRHPASVSDVPRSAESDPSSAVDALFERTCDYRCREIKIDLSSRHGEQPVR